MVKYVQTNEKDYVTGIVTEPILVGLFGGGVLKFQMKKLLQLNPY